MRAAVAPRRGTPFRDSERRPAMSRTTGPAGTTRAGLLWRREVPGTLLALALAGGALGLKQALSVAATVPDVFLALVLGALIVNTPLGRWLGAGPAEPANGLEARFGPGLAFVGKTVLRVAVVLMGLRIEAHAFGSGRVSTVALALVAVIPTTFFLTHTLAVPLRVPRALANLVAAGTMICGASAVNAVAPVIGARREEQGIALATVFLFSAVALVAFRGVAAAVGLSALDAGIWSGLAVNDLASAVSVGAQMGPGGAEMAAATKSARIVMLAPILIAFAIGRDTGASSTAARRTAARHLPPFVAGFVALALIRAAGDALFGGNPGWRALLIADQRVVELAMLMVSAGIGLHLKVRGLLASGARAMFLGAVAATSMAGLTLVLLVLARRGLTRDQLAVAAAALLASAAAYRFSIDRKSTQTRTQHVLTQREGR
jgi:uncharacterized integral membrane protein (TIGR00698 family)